MILNGNTVIMSAEDVKRFARMWPCSGMRRVKRIAFNFDQAGALLSIDAIGATVRTDATAIDAMLDEARETILLHKERP